MGLSRNAFSIIPIGGAGEIGMNMTIVEVDSRLLVIDCGVMFSSHGVGVDLVHNGYEVLAARRDDVEAVVLTHAHEDHIAGVPYLLQEVDVPIYGTSYALGLLEERMKEFEDCPKPCFHRFDPGTSVSIGPFSVRSFPMPHSIIQNTGLLIETPAGRIVHTGDFKLGMLSEHGGQDVLDQLRQVSQDGVDLLLCDSTGAEETDPAGEESMVEQAIDDLVVQAPGRVFAALFSSNIRRLETILKIARRRGRKVALSGRSVLNHVRVATACGELTIPADLLVPVEEIGALPRRQVMIVVSGTQGETRSALGRLADDNHRSLQIDDGDLVVFSSRFIPGNELAIAAVIDSLHRLGARVIHRGICNNVHVTGHGSSQEIEAAIRAVQPVNFIPLHGTYRHLWTCAEIARRVGIDNVLIAVDGQVVECPQGEAPRIVDAVPIRHVHLDGRVSLGDFELRDRRLLAQHGVLVVAFAIDDRLERAGPCSVVARGVVKEEMMPWFTQHVVDGVQAHWARIVEEADGNIDRAGEALRTTLRKYLSKNIGREPFIIVSLPLLSR